MDLSIGQGKAGTGREVDTAVASKQASKHMIVVDLNVQNRYCCCLPCGPLVLEFGIPNSKFPVPPCTTTTTSSSTFLEVNSSQLSAAVWYSVACLSIQQATSIALCLMHEGQAM